MHARSIIEAPLPWMQTASGRAVTLSRPAPDAISIRDIAAHLSKICRFAGATSTFYSVAQHSVLVAQLLAAHGPAAQMYGLLHDAHEAYIGDIPQPVKNLLNLALGMGAEWTPLYDLWTGLDATIHERAGLAWPIGANTRAAIRHADLRALATERRDLLADARPGTPEWDDLPEPARAAIKPWPWAKAEEKFLETYDELAILNGLPSFGALG